MSKFAGFPAGLEVRRDRPLRHWFIDRGGEGGPEAVTAHVLFQLWQVYLDNLDMREIVDEAALSEWVRTTSRSTDDAQAIYELYKMEPSEGKALISEPDGKLLGIFLYAGHRIRGQSDAVRSIVQLTLTTVVRPLCTRE